MALELNDLLAMRTLDEKSNSPFEQYLMSHKESKRASGTAIAGLVLGTVGAAAAIGAWIFGPTYANAKSNAAREAARGAADVANANHNALLTLYTQGMANTNANLDRLASTLATERNERIAGDVNLTNTVTDSVSGSQQGTLTAQQAAELSSIQSVQQNLFNQAVMGNLSENPQKVMLYSAPQACGCPGSCGCGN